VFVSHIWQYSVQFGYWAENKTISDAVFVMSRIGVAFFFVHTFLVLSLSLKRSPKQHLIRNFYIRRAFRIYPLCWAAILLALSTHLTDFQFTTIASLPAKWLVANFLLMQNIFHGPYSYGIIGPMWSLPWEVQMYLVLPFIFMFLDWWKNPLVSFSISLILTITAVLGMCYGVRHMSWSVFPPMFSGGMIAYQLLARKDNAKQWPELPGWLWPLLLVVLFAVPSLLMGDLETFSTWGAAVYSCDCILLGVSIAFFKEFSLRWLVKAAKEIAKYSYSIYLLHIPTIFFVYRYLPHLWHPLRIAFVVLLTGAVSIIAFHIIEDPMIQLGKSLTRTVATAARNSS
jgi:peptidoglycan/LPS O-acetylase OafA/YrhL